MAATTIPETVKIPTERLVELLANLKETEGVSGTYRRLIGLVTEQSLRVRVIDAVAGLEAARVEGNDGGATLAELRKSLRSYREGGRDG
jgi:hypothetical protein